MDLYHADFGGKGKPPLVILHGLLGSSKNWRTAGIDLAGHFHVFALDLRNHGRSPHAPEQTFELMAGDVVEWLDRNGLSASHLLGHSLGGKVSMRLACSYPEMVRSVCVVDIAPKPYPVDTRAFDALLGLKLAGVTSRNEADLRLRTDIPDRWLRQFLLSNLARDESGELVWQPNLPVLAASLPAIRKSPLGAGQRYEGPVLFVAGGRSSFIQAGDETVIREHFPQARLEILPDSGHYPHVDSRASFVRTIVAFAGKDGTGAV
jgi:pimeloyl-ACP methyl ester carboxylesterase